MKPKAVKYFTTFYTHQMIIFSLVYIGINIKMYELLFDGTALGAAIIILIQTMLLSSVTGYLTFGIEQNGGTKRKVVLFAALVLANALLILIAGAASLWAHMAAGCILAAVLGIKIRSINGDNRLVGEDTVQELDSFEKYNLVVYFPVDMGRKYRRHGILRQIGKAAGGKYAGQVVALVAYKDEIYICPYRYINMAGPSGEIQLVEDYQRKLLYRGEF